MKIFLFITSLLFFISTFSTTSADDIACDCTVSNVAFLYFKFVKTCTVKSKFAVTKANTTVISLNSKKPTDELNKDISFFYVFGKTMEYIPKGLDLLIANLTGIRFELTKLKHVTKENLAPFPELLMFASVGNSVQFIEKELFVNNPKIKYVSFRSNKITYIDANVFEVIGPNLAQLYMDGFTHATTNAAVVKVLDKLKDSELVKIENAPPLYQFWVEKQGGSGGDDEDCDAKLADKDAELATKNADIVSRDNQILELEDIVRRLTICNQDPENQECPSQDVVDKLLRRF